MSDVSGGAAVTRKQHDEILVATIAAGLLAAAGDRCSWIDAIEHAEMAVDHLHRKRKAVWVPMWLRDLLSPQ